MMFNNNISLAQQTSVPTFVSIAHYTQCTTDPGTPFQLADNQRDGNHAPSSMSAEAVTIDQHILQMKPSTCTSLCWSEHTL